MASIDRRAHPAGASFGTWAAPDGWPHRRMDWRHVPGAPARGNLLFAGGRGDFVEKYLEAFGHWHMRGWNVTAFDWRGQGGSRRDGEAAGVDSLDQLVDDLAALIAAWRSADSGPHVAIGHSMGGHLLLRVLAERKPALDAAILVAPMLTIKSGLLPPWGAAWIACMLSAFGWKHHPAWQLPATPPPVGSFRQSNLTGSAERYEDELWWWKKEPRYNLGAPSWGWLDAAYRSAYHLSSAALAGVEPPVLLIGSETDRLVSAAAIRRAASAIPRSELLMFPKSAHEILRESDEVRLAAYERIDSFLDEHAS